MYRINLNPFFAPSEMGGTETIGGDLSIDQMEDFLAGDPPTDDKAKEPKAPKEEIVDVPDDEQEPDVEQETEEIADNPEGEEEPDELELKDDDVVLKVPKRKEILAEFPELFKKFPTIESAIYREQQFSEIFPTIADAREAAGDIAALRNFESSLMQGDLEMTLNAVKSQDKNAFENLVSPENILNTLQKVDEKAFVGTVNYSVKSVLKQLFDKASKGTDENSQQIALAAQYVHNAIYGEYEVKAPVTTAKKTEQDPAKSEYEKRMQQMDQDAFTGAVKTVTDSAEKDLRKILEVSIDPKNFMTPYVKNKAIDDAMAIARKEVQGDNRFRQILNRQWKAAEQAKFSRESLLEVKKTIVAANRSAFQSAIKKVRADALKGNATRTNNRSRDDRPVERGRPAQRPSRSASSMQPDKMRGKTTLDLLMED